jgi:hypothetical protein
MTSQARIAELQTRIHVAAALIRGLDFGQGRDVRKAIAAVMGIVQSIADQLAAIAKGEEDGDS